MNILTFEQTFQGKKMFGAAGRYFRLLATVNPVNVLIGIGGQMYSRLDLVEAGAWVRLNDADPRSFDSVQIETSTLEDVKFVVTDGEAGYDRVFTAFSQSRTLTLPGNVTIGAAEVAVLAAATRGKAFFRADDANGGSIALGPPGITIANAAIVLKAGDLFEEEITASAKWQGIADMAGQVLRVMTAA